MGCDDLGHHTEMGLGLGVGFFICLKDLATVGFKFKFRPT